MRPYDSAVSLEDSLLGVHRSPLEREGKRLRCTASSDTVSSLECIISSYNGPLQWGGGCLYATKHMVPCIIV
jgi:hypothetical protein